MAQSHNLVPVTSRSSTFRADIQGLRGIAIILVVGLHLNLSGFSAGFIGVDIFLVISGYVITLSILKRPSRAFIANLSAFWEGRFVRIFPVAALVICVTVIATFLLQGKAFDSDLFDDARWASFYGTNFHLIQTGANYFIAGLDQSLFTHYWALAVEQQFYLAYPALLFGLSYLGSETSRINILRVFLVAVVIASASWSIFDTEMNIVSAYFSPFTRFWELAFGGFLATFASSNRWRMLPFLGLGLLGFSMVYLNSSSAYPGYLAWVPVLGTGLLLYSPLKFLGITPLRYLGDISYSLYLWHFIWLVLPNQLEDPITDQRMTWVFLAGAIITAVLSYQFFEKPIHKSVALKADGYSALTVGLTCLLGTWVVISIVENIYLQANV